MGRKAAPKPARRPRIRRVKTITRLPDRLPHPDLPEPDMAEPVEHRRILDEDTDPRDYYNDSDESASELKDLDFN